jgi:hypothetical protein
MNVSLTNAIQSARGIAQKVNSGGLKSEITSIGDSRMREVVKTADNSVHRVKDTFFKEGQRVKDIMTYPDGSFTSWQYKPNTDEILRQVHYDASGAMYIR